jgi:hypothetical protein
MKWTRSQIRYWRIAIFALVAISAIARFTIGAKAGLLVLFGVPVIAGMVKTMWTIWRGPQ